MNARPFLPVLAFLATAALLRAEEPRRNVTAECQMVTLPQKAALALLPELNDDTKIEAAFAKLQTMIERGEAKLAANLVAKARDREKATAESTEEFRYATEFEVPKLPEKPEQLKDWPVVGVTPTGFESRNVGTTLEITTRPLDRGRVLSVTAIPHHVRLKRMLHFDAGHLPNGEHLGMDQPEFGSTKNACSLLMRNGQRVLLGVHKFADDPAETWEFFILKVAAVVAP